jgi:broad specificity phosphatase PhoE
LVHVEPSVPSTRWRLSDEGRNAARHLGRVLARRTPPPRTVTASSETKARETATELASVLGDPEVRVDDRLDEVNRPWTDDATVYRRTALAWLSGDHPDGWETPVAVLTRVSGALNELVPDSIAVTHGLALTLWLASVLPGEVYPRSFWSDLAMPDAWMIDTNQQTLVRTG